MALLWMTSAGTAHAADPDSDPQLKQIADAIRAWRESIVNVRIKYECTFEGGHLDSKEPGAVDPTLCQYGMDWIWTDSGKFRIYEWSLKDGKYDGDMLFTIDGQRRYIFRKPQGDPPQKPYEVSIGSVPRGTNRGVSPLDGLWFAPRAEWLSELLDAGRGEIAGTETVGGRELPKLKVIEAGGYPCWVTVDPERGFLPCVTDGGTKGRLRSEIQEFQQLDAPNIWFPLKGVETAWIDGSIYFRKHWRVTEVKVNVNFEPSLFRPHIPDGAHVIDQLSGRHYVKGAKSSPKQASQSAPPEPVAGTAVGGTAVGGAPQPGFWQRWTVPLLLAFCAVLLTAAWLVRRRISIEDTDN